MKVIIVGAFQEITELCELCGYEIQGIFDNIIRKKFLDYPILGTDSDAYQFNEKYKQYPVIISPDIPAVRQRLVKYYKKAGYCFCNLISPHASISKSAIYGSGIVIQSFTNISSSVILGDFVKINTFANIMHDVCIGNYVTVAPNAVVLGKVKVGERTYIGANSTLLPNIDVGKNVLIGAASVVTKSMQDNIVCAGNPCRFKRENSYD